MAIPAKQLYKFRGAAKEGPGDGSAHEGREGGRGEDERGRIEREEVDGGAG